MYLKNVSNLLSNCLQAALTLDGLNSVSLKLSSSQIVLKTLGTSFSRTGLVLYVNRLDISTIT
jgi:hypothetical protein